MPKETGRKAAELPQALRLADELRKMDEAKKYHPSGPGGQMLGCEQYRLIASGFTFEHLQSAAAELRRLYAENEALRAQPAGAPHVQNPAEIEHVAEDVSKNGAEVNMAYAELPPRYYLVGGVEKAWDHQQMHAFADATHTLRASHGQAPAGATLRSMIEGMSVSLDVSTGDHDAGHRYFGTVTEVMECQGDKHGVTLLVQDAEPNFAAPTPQAAQPAPATQQVGERVYAFRRKGLADFCTCDEARYGELSNKPHLFETRIFYTAPQSLAAQAPATQQAGWKSVPVEPTVAQEWAGKQAALRGSTMAEACKIYKAMLAAAPQPSPTAQADSAPAAICNACGADLLEVKQSPNSYLSAEQFDADKLGDWYCKCCPKGPSEGGSAHRYFWNRDLGAAAPQADSQPAPVLDYPPLPRVGAIGYASVVDIESYAKTLTIGPHLPGVRDIALWTTDQMRAYADETYALRIGAKHA